ncbi:2513_t:CDS:2, partial [Ambispora gerdemannii]
YNLNSWTSIGLWQYCDAILLFSFQNSQNISSARIGHNNQPNHATYNSITSDGLTFGGGYEFYIKEPLQENEQERNQLESLLRTDNESYTKHLNHYLKNSHQKLLQRLQNRHILELTELQEEFKQDEPLIRQYSPTVDKLKIENRVQDLLCNNDVRDTVKVKDAIASMIEEVREKDTFLSLDDLSDAYKRRNQTLRNAQHSEFEMLRVLLSQDAINLIQFSSPPQHNPELAGLLNQASTLPADQLSIIQTLISTMVMNNSQKQRPN